MASVHVHTKNCELENGLQAHIEEKLEHLERLWPKSDEAQVRLGHERGRYAAEVTIFSGGMVLRGEDRSTNMRQAVDCAIEKLESQMRRYKKKVIARDRRHDNRDDVSGEVLNVRMPNAGMSADGISPSAAVQNGK